jgi:uncharacterized membrane protein YgcG
MLRRLSRAWLLLLAPLLVGCQPDIGDECSTALDCSTIGDRLCDSSQPDGYCTIFNCEPDTCPDEAACVAFNQELDPACGYVDDGRYGRFARTFCMYVCEDDDDCRSGYQCVRPSDRRASVVDKDTDTDDPQSTRVCLVIGSTPQVPGEAPEMCSPPDPGTLPDPYVPDAGASGAGGAGGAAGAGGAVGGAGGSSGGGGGSPAGGAGGA